MRLNSVILMFTSISLIIVFSGFAFFYLKFLPNPRTAIRCQNDWSTISFLIDEEQRSIIMAGEAIDPKSVKIFNETAITARWKHRSGETKVFLDRISGRLEVQTRERAIEWNKNEFECVHSNIRF